MLQQTLICLLVQIADVRCNIGVVLWEQGAVEDAVAAWEQVR